MTTILELIDTPPGPSDGYAIPSIDGLTGWRNVAELADPSAGAAVVWHDITEYWLGYSLRLGATEYAGRFRATIADIELMADGETLAPWNPDTSATFGVHVDLGSGVLLRYSLIRVAGGVVVEWLPRFTLKVRKWRDCGYARGQIRRHPIVARDTITSLVGVPVPAQLEEDWSDRVVNILAAANWPYGLLAYHDFALTVPDRDEQASAITELDQTLDPAGLVMYTDRQGHLVIRPKIGDTLHGDAAFGLGFGTFWFHYLAGDDTFGLIEYPDGADLGSVDLADDEAAVRNHVKVSYSFPAPGVFDDEDAASIVRHDRHTFQASWIAQNDQAAQDILDYRSGATKQLEPLQTTNLLSGFRHALDIEYLNPGLITHKHSASEPTIDATGHARYLEETCIPLGGGAGIDMRIRATVDVNSWEISATMLPVEDLAVTALGPTGAEFSWTNPGGQPITPTHTQVRLYPVTSIWSTVAYPITAFDWGGLDPETPYQFQVRLAAFSGGLLADASPARSVAFTTTAAEVPDGDGNLPDPPGGCSSVEWELFESTDPETWADPDVPEYDPTPIESGEVTSPPWEVDMSGFTFDPTKLYRLASNACGAGWVYSNPFTGECTDPPALTAAPYDFAELEAYWPAMCPPDVIVEAITEEPATHGPAFDLVVLDGDSNIVIVSDGEGLVAYGAGPAAVDALTGDTTIAARVLVTTQPDGSPVLFGAAGLWIELVAEDANWQPIGKAHESGAGITTITPAGTVELDFGAWYDIALVHDVAAGDLMLYVDAVEVATALGTVGTRHNPGLFEIGVPEASLVTNCAVWSRVLEPEELPGYTLPAVLDDFNRANGGVEVGQPLWVGSTAFDVQSNALISTGTDRNVTWDHDWGSPDLWAEFTVLATGGTGTHNIGLYLRRSGTGGAVTYYMARYTTGGWEILRRVAGTFTSLASTGTPTPSVPVRVRFEAETVAGNVELRFYEVTGGLGGTPTSRLTFTDSSGSKILTGNYIGMRASNNTPSVDDFSGGAL